MLFLLLLVFALHMDEALGAQTKTRKLSEILFLYYNLLHIDIHVELLVKDLLIILDDLTQLLVFT